jgi:hypothetical protein
VRSFGTNGCQSTTSEQLAGLFVVETFLTIYHPAALKAFRAALKPDNKR